MRVFILATMGAALMLMSLMSNAQTSNRSVMRTIETPVVMSKQEAYDLALVELQTLQLLTSSELNRTFLPARYGLVFNKTSIKPGSYITVQEQMNAQGRIEFIGKVNFKLKYVEQDSSGS